MLTLSCPTVAANIAHQIIQSLASERHTMPLKSLCHAIVSSAHNLDVLVMAVGIERLLGPVCQLLDTWQHDEDHGEACRGSWHIKVLD